MASFLKSPEAKNVMLSIIASVIAGTVTIYLAGTYMANKASQATVARTMAINRTIQTEYIGDIGHMRSVDSNIGHGTTINHIGNGNSNINSNDINNRIERMERVQRTEVSMNSSIPKLSVSITTSEFYNNDWNPVLVHTFYGKDEEELANLIQAHRMTDKFFAASFVGIFDWKGSKIELKNSEPKLLYV